MSLALFVTIILSVTVSAIAQVCFKIGLNSLNQPATPTLSSPLYTLGLAVLTPGVMAGLGLYAVGALLWLIALRRVELSQAYPFVGFGFALTTLAGWWLFNELVSIQRGVGIGLIFLGITLLART